MLGTEQKTMNKLATVLRLTHFLCSSICIKLKHLSNASAFSLAIALQRCISIPDFVQGLVNTYKHQPQTGRILTILSIPHGLSGDVCRQDKPHMRTLQKSLSFYKVFRKG